MLSPPYLKQFRGAVKPRPPSESMQAEFQVRLTKVQPLQNLMFLVSPLSGDSSSLVWAEWVLQFPSFGCVLHQLLCLCKTCNDLTHHDSTEMSQDHEFEFSGGTMPMMQGEEGYSKWGCRPTKQFRRVALLCLCSSWGTVNLLMFGIFC